MLRRTSSLKTYSFILALATTIAILVMLPGAAHARPNMQTAVIEASELHGFLPHQYSKHYLGLDPSRRDGIIELLLTYEPSNDFSNQGFVNFAVLTEDGLRRYLAGAELMSVTFASGSPVLNDKESNKLFAAFKDSGHGAYTIIVYNNLQRPAQYKLSTFGATLLDDAEQTSVSASDAQLQTVSVDADVAPASSNPAGSAVATTAIAPLPDVRALRLTSTLDPNPDRHYFSLEPAIKDSVVVLDFVYEPEGESALVDNINFFVLTEDGFRRMVAGDRPEDVNVATGYPIPNSDEANRFWAGFRDSGRGTYTVMVFNDGEVPASYSIGIDGGILIDRLRQTNEAEASVAELETAEVLAESTQFINDDLFGATSVSSNLSVAFEHHYFGLLPRVSDTRVQITMDYRVLGGEIAVEGSVNFWVLDKDGLRKVISGARPADVNIASGALTAPRWR